MQPQCAARAGVPISPRTAIATAARGTPNRMLMLVSSSGRLTTPNLGAPAFPNAEEVGEPTRFLKIDRVSEVPVILRLSRPDRYRLDHCGGVLAKRLFGRIGRSECPSDARIAAMRCGTIVPAETGEKRETTRAESRKSQT